MNKFFVCIYFTLSCVKLLTFTNQLAYFHQPEKFRTAFFGARRRLEINFKAKYPVKCYGLSSEKCNPQALHNIYTNLKIDRIDAIKSAGDHG